MTEQDELRAELDAIIREAVPEDEIDRFKAYVEFGSELWKIGLNPIIFIHGDIG